MLITQQLTTLLLSVNGRDEYIAKLLSKIKNTSPGYDGIPSWFYRSFSTEMSHVIRKIINVSVACGFVPNAWKHAVVTPVLNPSVILLHVPVTLDLFL